ncbi:MAG: hypothetical protein AAB210_01900, partial [Deltaproteobacteria bacterium]
NLAIRMRKENDLSDVTWAMADSCPEFLNLFMQVFGFKDFDQEKPSNISREHSGEYPEGNNRVDFFVTNGDNSFIIENKIYDKNYHFKEYSESFKVKGYGIITNHEIKGADECGFVIRQWCDFVESLKNANFEETDRPIIKGYISYVKEVCSMKEIKEIRFDKLNSLYYFSNLIEKIIQEYNYSLYNTIHACGNGDTGKYFILKKGTNEIWPWFGINYEDDPPVIGLAFDRYWCKSIFKEYKGKPQKGTMFDIEEYKYAGGGSVSFDLPEEKFNEFKEGSKEQQKSILKEFFNNVIDEISKHLG